MNKLPQPTEVSDAKVHIPECCINGDPECPHVINADKKQRIRKNIAL